MEDEPKSEAMGRIALWSYELNMQLAAICHKHSA